jgi:hypothetical protein
MTTSSVPMIRSLFVRKKQPSYSYEMRSDYPSRGATKGYGVQSYVNSRAASKNHPGPDSSEENILPMQSHPPQSVIAKSTSYSVDYELKKDAESDE